MLDLVLRLSWPVDYSADDGARFELRFDKARSVRGDAVAPFEVTLVSDSWTVTDISRLKYAQAVEMFEGGAHARDVEEALGIGRATAYRYFKQARAEGKLLSRKPRRQSPKTRARSTSYHRDSAD